MGEAKRCQTLEVRRVTRVVSDLERSETFYREALGFQTVSHQQCDPAILSALGSSGAAREVLLQLGQEVISLVQFAAPGNAYPRDSRSDDLWFQHLAIVVSDMAEACDHLERQHGWHPISRDGRQHLPPANGGVWAFKFRDPDGHPLELIWFPPGEGRAVWRDRRPGALFLGIDHSALAVSASNVSADFYRGLGFKVSNRSFNRGPAQSRLDGLSRAQVRVTALRPFSEASMGLELLAYDPPGRPNAAPSLNDMVTDWVTLAVSPLSGDGALTGRRPQALRDPDGHRLLLED